MIPSFNFRQLPPAIQCAFWLSANPPQDVSAGERAQLISTLGQPAFVAEPLRSFQLGHVQQMPERLEAVPPGDL